MTAHIDDVLKDLFNPDSSSYHSRDYRQAEAARALGAFPAPLVVPHLLRALASITHAGVQAALLGSLKGHGKDQLARAILAALDSWDHQTLCTVILSLG